MPDMIENLVSLSRLMSTSQYMVKFDSTGCRIQSLYDSSSAIHVYVSESLYCLDARPLEAAAYVSTTAQIEPASQSMLWHSRLAHVHESKLLSLQKLNVYRHLFPHFSSLPFCEACAKGKSKQAPYASLGQLLSWN